MARGRGERGGGMAIWGVPGRHLHATSSAARPPQPAPQPAAQAATPHLAGLDGGDLGADGNHGVAETVQLLLALALGRLNHERACATGAGAGEAGGEPRATQAGGAQRGGAHAHVTWLARCWPPGCASKRRLAPAAPRSAPATGQDIVGAWNPKSISRLAMSSASIPVASVMGLRGGQGAGVGAGRGQRQCERAAGLAASCDVCSSSGRQSCNTPPSP